MLQNKGLKTQLEHCFPESESAEVVAFLEKGFSQDGETFVAEAMMYAKRIGVSAKQIIAAAQSLWEKTWKNQALAARGDPGCPGNVGDENLAAITSLFKELGIVDPFVEAKKIPKAVMVVKTRNAVYAIGELDSIGRRSVTRESGNPLPCTQCEIWFLVKGKGMRFKWWDENTMYRAQTSPVESITLVTA